MPAYWIDVALVLMLILLNAAFAGSEMALVSLREGQLKQLERRTDARARRLVRLARDPNRFLATIQVGITLAGFLASATAAVSLAEPLVPYLTALGGAAEAAAVACVTLVLTFFTLVLGELAPKRLAMQRALPWALVAAGPISAVSWVARPAIVVLGRASNAVVRLLGGRVDGDDEEISPEELEGLVATHRGLHVEQREIISATLELDRRTLRQVLVPRGKVFTLDARMSVRDALQALAEAGHSRVPVTEGHHLDDVVGVVHWTSLVAPGEVPVRARAAPALFLPDSARVSDALRLFKSLRQQLAVVVDEHGSVDGIVTLEDLLEEVVGEIYDETDPDLLSVERTPEGDLVLPGTYPLHDLPDVGVDLGASPRGQYTTVAGLLIDRLGKVPTRAGESVHVDGWVLEVLAVVGRAVTRVRVHRPDTEAAGDGRERG